MTVRCEDKIIVLKLTFLALRFRSRVCSWGGTWQHFDNLDHVRPTTGVPTWDAPSKWNLPGREFPGPSAE